MNSNSNSKGRSDDNFYYDLMEEDELKEGVSPLLSFSPSVSSFSSMESFQTSNNTTLGDYYGTTTTLSRMESDSGLSGKTVLVRLPLGEQIERDSGTEEQLARIRKEIEEMESKAVASNDLNRRRSRKDLVKVSLEEGLPVALHPRDSDTKSERELEQENMFGGMRIVDEDRRNYILMYDMLTGIRTSVSRCQANRLVL